MTEYLYCLVYAEWDFTKDFVHGGSLAPEWSDSHLDASSIEKDNPWVINYTMNIFQTIIIRCKL